MTEETQQGGASPTHGLDPWAPRLAKWGPRLAVLALAAGIASGLGHRLGLWHYGVSFKILFPAAWAGLAGAVICLVAAFLTRPGRAGPVRAGFVPALVGVVLGAAVAWVPWQARQVAYSVPAIHDITTDTDNPPLFVDVLALRADAPNSAEYGGPELVKMQQEGYPGLTGLHPDAAPADVLAAAEKVALAMGWEIVAVVADEGRLEATDTTFWFGFKDDVVVRVAAADGAGSVVDIRSVSRVGRSDVGANARRIEDFLGRLKTALAGS